MWISGEACAGCLLSAPARGGENDPGQPSGLRPPSWQDGPCGPTFLLFSREDWQGSASTRARGASQRRRKRCGHAADAATWGAAPYPMSRSPFKCPRRRGRERPRPAFRPTASELAGRAMRPYHLLFRREEAKRRRKRSAPRETAGHINRRRIPPRPAGGPTGRFRGLGGGRVG